MNVSITVGEKRKLVVEIDVDVKKTKLTPRTSSFPLQYQAEGPCTVGEYIEQHREQFSEKQYKMLLKNKVQIGRLAAENYRLFYGKDPKCATWVYGGKTVSLNIYRDAEHGSLHDALRETLRLNKV